MRDVLSQRIDVRMCLAVHGATKSLISEPVPLAGTTLLSGDPRTACHDLGQWTAKERPSAASPKMGPLGITNNWTAVKKYPPIHSPWPLMKEAPFSITDTYPLLDSNLAT